MKTEPKLENSEGDMVQSYFCTTKESDQLLKLRLFIRANIFRYNDSSTNLQFIPIENGALTRYGNKIYSDLIKIILDFNLTQLNTILK